MLHKERNVNIGALLEKAEKSEKGALSERESGAFLREYGIPVVKNIFAENADAAVRAAQENGFPAVLKGTGASLLHKTEMGIVHLNLRDSEAVKKAALSVAEKAGDKLEGFLIQPYLRGKREFVAGLFRDEQFGPVVMFGLGGIFTEAFSDVVFRLAPLSASDAEEMIGEIRTESLLGAFRGESAVNREQIIDTLMGLSRIAMEHPEIAEIDINPLLVQASGEICAADALVIVRNVQKEKNFLPPVDPVMMGRFFYPRSIAFVGASAQLGKWGQNLLSITISRGYEGKIWLVNPKGGTIAGRKVYPSVKDIPESVDLAVVTIPAAAVPALIPQFTEKGIRNMLLITSGFAETGEDGRKLEKELMQIARAAGILIVGPNTMGVCNPHIRLYCTGSHVWPEPGDTGVVAQSGNMGTQLLAYAEKQKIGIRGFVGSGNEGMITIEDYLESFEVDKITKNVMLYVESVKNGRRFFETARRMGKKKPIVMLKGGRTRAGGRAAASHTGAMSSDAKIFDAMCRQSGIVMAEYPMDLLDLSAAFSSLPLPKGKRAAIMTLGGGWGVVTADLCDEYRLQVPDLSPELIAKIDKYLPPYWSKSNPVDVVGEFDNDMARGILEELMAWEGCDAVINLGLIGRKALLERLADSTLKSDPSYTAEFLNSAVALITDMEKQYIAFMSELMEKYEKPVYGVSISFSQDEQTVYRTEGRKYSGVLYPSPERAVKVFAKMYEYWKFVTR
ncbi:MAG: acetate--CoA ligase family protein [Desulfococcaceae bacterium]